jgi:hypothetical protein
MTTETTNYFVNNVCRNSINMSWKTLQVSYSRPVKRSALIFKISYTLKLYNSFVQLWPTSFSSHMDQHSKHIIRPWHGGVLKLYWEAQMKINSIHQFLTSSFHLVAHDRFAYRINLITSLTCNISIPEMRMLDFWLEQKINKLRLGSHEQLMGIWYLITEKHMGSRQK